MVVRPGLKPCTSGPDACSVGSSAPWVQARWVQTPQTPRIPPDPPACAWVQTPCVWTPASMCGSNMCVNSTKQACIPPMRTPPSKHVCSAPASMGPTRVRVQLGTCVCMQTPASMGCLSPRHGSVDSAMACQTLCASMKCGCCHGMPRQLHHSNMNSLVKPLML